MQSVEKQVADAIRRKKIKQITRSIRKKYLSLKLGKSEEDESLNKLFQAVTAPLKQIVQTSMMSTPLKVNPFSKIRVKKEEMKEEDQEPRVKFESAIPGPSFLRTESVAETSFGNSDDDAADDTVFLDTIQGGEPLSEEASQEYMDQFPEISQRYVAEYQLNDDKIDTKYGPTYDEVTSKWKLGKKVINFDRATGNIIVDKHTFNGSPGLYQLIFYDRPEYKGEDMAQYKELLQLTGAHLKSNGTLKPSGSLKYHNIIRPFFSNTPSSTRISSRLPTRSHPEIGRAHV